MRSVYIAFMRDEEINGRLFEFWCVYLIFPSFSSFSPYEWYLNEIVSVENSIESWECKWKEKVTRTPAVIKNIKDFPFSSIINFACGYHSHFVIRKNPE